MTGEHTAGLPENILQGVFTGIGVALGDEGYRDPETGTLQYKILSRKPSVSPLHAETEC